MTDASAGARSASPREDGTGARRRIGITGASGHIGGRVAALLAERGQDDHLRLVVRDASRAPDLTGGAALEEGAALERGAAREGGADPGSGPEVAVAAFGDATACRAAFAGVDTLLLVSAGESDDRVEQHRTAIAAAADAGVRHLVYTSFTGASADAEFTLARDHGATEDAIRDAADRTGMTWTLLRDDFYLDVLLPWAGEDRTLRGPAGTGRCAFVAREDVAQVAAAVLVAPDSWCNVTLDLTGGESLSLDEVAERMTAALGETYAYIDETMDEARASRAPYGAPDWQVDAWISTYTAIASGALGEVSGDVQRVIGREPLRLEDVLGETPGA